MHKKIKIDSMKIMYNFLFLALFFSGNAQPLPQNLRIQEFKNCKNKACQIKESFLIAEYYLDIDDIQSSQKWLDIVKKLNSSKKVDTTDVFIHSLQSELFYYNGLFQFGVTEADKAIADAIQLNDSLLISEGYLFKGINLFELNKLNESQQMLWKSKNVQPQNFQKRRIRTIILNEHIYNNLAQIKQRMKQPDSALWYNSKAYIFAKQNNSKRGIPNIEQTFGQIYVENNKTDAAITYLNKSILSAEKSNYYDIILSNYGFLLHCYPNNLQETNKIFTKAIALIKQEKINISYQSYFYSTAINAFRKHNQLEKLAFAQEQLISINKNIALVNNDNIQNITKQYVKNETKLIKQELFLIKNSKEKQIFYILVITLILITGSLWYFFKQRQKLKNKEIETLKQNQEIAQLEALIDGEEKERKRIAQELHDGLNGDLSAIKYRLSTLEESGLSAIDTENLTKVIAMIDGACAQVRSISHNLIPTTILDFGLVATVEQYCAKINNSHPLTLYFQYFGNAAVLPKKAETVIYRIIQELINNISKHSKATTAMVQFNFHENELFITVEDNGIGFDTTSAHNGLGLKNINSRVLHLNAQLEIESNAKGTSIHITVNLNTLKND